MKLGLGRLVYREDDYLKLEIRFNSLFKLLQQNYDKETIEVSDLCLNEIGDYDNLCFDLNGLEIKTKTILETKTFKKGETIFLPDYFLAESHRKINGVSSNKELITNYVDIIKHADVCCYCIAKKDFKLEYYEDIEVVDKKQLYDILEDFKTIYQTMVEEKQKELNSMIKRIQSLDKGKA